MSEGGSAPCAVASCDLCGSGVVGRTYRRGDGMRVVECPRCGLAYLSPRTLPTMPGDIYGRDYFDGSRAARGVGGLSCDRDPDAGREEELGSVLRMIAAQCGSLAGKSVLEIGCATGDQLVRLRDAGARVQGLEVSPFAAAAARSRGLTVEIGTIEDLASAPEGGFDIVVAQEVLEHVASPTSFLRHAARLLRSGGTLFLSTPNYALARRFGDRWLGFNTSYEHLYYFSLDALERVAGGTGLHLEAWETSRAPGGPLKTSSSAADWGWKASYLRFLVRRCGLAATLRTLRRRGHYRRGLGHTLRVVFVKSAEPGSVGQRAAQRREKVG